MNHRNGIHEDEGATQERGGGGFDRDEPRGFDRDFSGKSAGRDRGAWGYTNDRTAGAWGLSPRWQSEGARHFSESQGMGRRDWGGRNDESAMGRSYDDHGRASMRDAYGREDFEQGRRGGRDAYRDAWNQPYGRSLNQPFEGGGAYGYREPYGSPGPRQHPGWYGTGGQMSSRFGAGSPYGYGYGQRGAWMREGPHRGRGPKGYKRSDERIREDVCDRLTDHPDIDASDIDVLVQGQEVTLTGTVPERRLKHLAEYLAEDVAGVQEVHNQLRVRREEQRAAASPDRNGEAGSRSSRSS
ncbi:MAG TPA: BON domain-containing protein [Minicystis sp.]|nr:BON domain-containing protein [Minicystis sp.]